MTVKDLICALLDHPLDATVYVTDNGTTHLPEWNASVQEVDQSKGTGRITGDVMLRFEGAFLCAAIEQDEE